MSKLKSTTTNPARHRLIAYGYLLVNTLCWGASLVVVKPSLEFTTPFRFLLYRYAIAAILSIGFIFKNWHGIRKKPQVLGDIIWLELIGLTLTLALLYTGLAHTTALEASFISTTAPVFLTIASIIFLHEQQSRREWQGLGLAFIGTIILIFEPWLSGQLNQSNQSAHQSSLLGNVLIIGQNLTTIVYFLLAKSRYRGLPKLFVSGISFWVGLVSFALLSWWEAGFSIATLFTQITADLTHQSVWVASIYMAIFGSIIGLTAYIHGQEGIEASEASLFWYLQPLVYVPLGVIFLHEYLSIWQAAALVLIGIGVFWAQKRFSLVKMRKLIA